MTQDAIMSKTAPKPVGLYPHAKRVGDLLFLSGVGPRKAGQETIPGVELDAAGIVLQYDIETQCHNVFDNVNTILQDAGASLDNLVDITVFLTNMRADFNVFNRLYADYFAKVQPCRTTVQVESLPTPIAIELKCVAYLGGQA